MTDTVLFVFLGNPGREYAATRHNAGWLVAEELERRIAAERIALVPPPPLNWTQKFDGAFASASLSSRKLLFFKPGVFMNLSGQATRKLMDFYKLGLESLVVVHDELELPYGQLAWRKGGGAGGHNGLRSLDTNCGGPGYLRCRVGIGRPRHGSVADWVLARFSPDEEAVLALILEKAAEQILQNAQGKPIPSGKTEAFQSVPAKR